MSKQNAQEQRSNQMNNKNQNPEDRDDLAPEDIENIEELQDIADSAEEQPAAATEDMTDSAAQIAELEARLAESKNQTLRALADAENTRKRAQKERDDTKKYAIAGFARDLLDFADNFHRAVESLPEDLVNSDERIKNVVSGIQAMEREILAVFERHGIRKIEPMGEMFNPHYHEVMFESPGTGQPPGTIIQVMDTGYVLHERLLRPARVGVAKGDAQSAGDTGGQVDTEA